MDILSKTLITGGGGMVGGYVDFGVITNRSILDINNPENIRLVFKKYKPKVILHLAAETDVDFCERNPDRAYLINTIGTLNIAKGALDIGAKLVYVSTAGVFDGNKKTPYTVFDIPNPQNYYSRSKYLGELIVQSFLKDYLIVRAGWVFGGGKNDHKFVGKITSLILKNSKIEVVHDTKGSPVYGKDLIEGIKSLIIDEKRGIVHLANKGQANRYEMAKIISKVVNPKVEIVKVDSSKFKNLDVKRIKSEAILTSISMRGWREALVEYLEEEWLSSDRVLGK